MRTIEATTIMSPAGAEATTVRTRLAQREAFRGLLVPLLTISLLRRRSLFGVRAPIQGSTQGCPRWTERRPRHTVEVSGRSPRHPTEGSASTMNDIHHSFARQGLVRPQEGRVLGGVTAGLGRRFGIEPWPARLLFVLLLMVIPGSQILVYPILWLLMPSEETVTCQPRPARPTPAA